MTHLHGPDETGLSYWLDTTPATNFTPLEEDARAEVAVVGAGIAGITAAYLLAKAGKNVIVLDRERVATMVTGHTTAHLQIVIDTPLAELDDRIGLEEAKLAWDSQLEAVRLIESLVREERIACDFERLDAILYTPKENERDDLLEEALLARRIGYAAEEVPASEVPYPVARAAIRYPDQGKFHPRKYLLALVEKARALGVRFHEGTNVTALHSGEPARLETEDGHTITADWVVVSTQAPFHTRMRLFPKLYPYNSYVIGARVPKGVFENRLYWDTEKPGYHYTRVEPGPERDLVILGGEDQKVGHGGNTRERYAKLEAYLRAAAPEAEIAYRWSSMWYETQDGLPYIGRVPGGPENELVATGFSGTGMTNGTIAASMIAERILGRGTPWDDLYDPARITEGGGRVARLGKEILHDATRAVKSPFARSEVDSLRDIKPGEGAILRHGLAKLAVSRDEAGNLHACKATCTHAGCTVAWNPAERAWDCPCHGSRFDARGDVILGPANLPLAPFDVAELVKETPRREERPR